MKSIPSILHNTYTGTNEPSKRNYVTIYHFEFENVILETHFFNTAAIENDIVEESAFFDLAAD